MVRNTKSN